MLPSSFLILVHIFSIEQWPLTFLSTGAGSGIGRVTARYLLQRGYKVFLTDADGAFLEETCTKHLPSVLPEEKGKQWKWMKMDVTKDEEIKAAVESCINEFGRMDVLMNSTFSSDSASNSMEE